MKKIITYGTYDLFHEGHYNMLKRAKAAGDYLIVGVTGDNYDIGRGKLSVKDSLATRIQNVKDTGFADEIIVEEYLGQKISDIIKYDIDAFVIGDDWKGKFDHLSNYCEMIYLERTQGISSTQIREENFKTNRIGIITDQTDDNQIVSESKLVSGFKVSGVFSPDYTKSVLFRDKYQLDTSYSNEEELFADTDIIYIRTAVEDRYNYVKTAVLKGKHVICDPPFALETDKQKELFELAKSKNVILMDNAKMVNINTFNQLLWMTQAGIIGDIIKFNCSVSKKNRDIDDIFFGLMAMALCPMVKIMGCDYTSIHTKTAKENGNIEFASAIVEYPVGEAVINVGNQIRVENKMEIIGTKGTIRLRDNWWKGNYFELDKVGSSEPEIFNMNFEGNGFKFLLRQFASMLKNGRTESMGLFNRESIKITEILETIIKEGK